MPDLAEIDDRIDSASARPFGRRFPLRGRERATAELRGPQTIRAHAAEIIAARLVPAESVGSVTGVVGAAGGLGGFFPPLVMGLVYGVLADYTVGFLLLAATAAAAGAFTATRMRRRAHT